MRLTSQKYWLSFLVLVAIIDTCSSENDNLQEGRRNARVSGRIVKLYSGPKPDPVICLGEGFQKDNVDCSVFYRCLKASNGKYTVYRFQCGPGTVYDPETEVCNHPRRTKRLECGGFGSDKLISTTERYFENEIEGSHKENYEIPSPITTKSPVGLTDVSSVLVASNSDILSNSYVTTSYPWITTSSPAVVTMASTASTWHKLTSVSTKKPSDYTTAETTSHTTPRANSRDNQCVSDGFMGDSEDCRKFYRCVNNQRGGYLRYEFSCSESTIWDDDTQGCNHAWAVRRRRCGKGYIENDLNDIKKNKYNELPPNSTFQEQTQISYGSRVTQSQVQISHGSVVQNQTQINFGDRLNYDSPGIKQNQTQISHGSAVSQTQTQINYGNKATQTQLQVDHSNHSSQTQTQVIEFSSSTSSASSQNVIDGRNKCTKDGFLGDSNDCRKFYRCVSDGRSGFKRHEFSCSEGTLWDQNLEACNHAWAVKDCGALSSQSTHTAVTSTKPTLAYYTTTSSFLNNEIEDVAGYDNQNNKEELEQPKHSTQTVSSSTSTTEPLKSVESDCQSNGFFGNADDCTKFYRCIENGRGGFTKYEYKCGDGTVWDSNIESCNHAWAVKQCGSSVNKQDTGTSTTEKAILTTVSLIQTTTQKNIYDTNYDSGYGSLQRETSQPPHLSTERTSGNTCRVSGFMGDDSDCKKFYRCVGNGNGQFTRHEFTCGEGTVWDPEIEACNHVWAVKRCGGNVIKDQEIPSNTVSQAEAEEDNGYNIPHDTSKDTEISTQSTTQSTTISSGLTVNKEKDCEVSGFMGDDKDCKIFYRCVENGNGGFTRYQFSCGDGTVWDPKISACNHASAVEKCGGGRPEETIPTTLDSGSTISSTTTEMPPKNTTYYTTMSASETSTSTTSDHNNQCVNNEFIGDKHDCKKFYRCVDDGKGGFIRYEFSCGEGTVWDPKIEACNHAWAVDSCGGNKPSVVTASSTTSIPIKVTDGNDDSNNVTQLTTTPYTTTNTPTPTTSKPLKSQICEQEGFIGDNLDCKKFYRCTDNGKGGFNKYEFTCGEGTVWDQTILACNHESSDRRCSSTESENHTESIESSATSVTISPPKSTTTSSFESTEKTESSSNKDECTSEGFYANSNDCKKFYRCVNDGKGTFTKYDFTCGEGTVWVQDILACDHDSDNSYCGIATITSSTSSQSSQEQSLTSSTAVITSSTTNMYISTANDDYTSTSSIKPASQTDEVCQSEGFYANSRDCTKFYQCVNNGDGGYRKYEFSCSEGTAWDINTQSCNHINEVKSCKNSNQAESQTKPALQDESTSETSSTTIDPSVESSTSSTTKDPSVASSTSSLNQDSCDSEGYFGNSKDCKKFYRCVDNGKGGFTKYDYTCGDGTIWDQEITACNHPQDVLNPSCSNATSSTSTTTSASSESSSETTTKSTSSTSEASEPATASSDNQTSQSESTKNPNNNNYTCTEAGFYPDPYDCKKFYRCVDWDGEGKSFSIFHFECGEGTIWDPEVQTCNHEESVYPPRECSGAQSQNNNETEETQGTTSKQEETTESSTTTQSTTQKSTTQGSSSTTESSSTTDQTSTTQKSTTQQPSTEQSTTQQSTTEQSTTQQSTTEQGTTQKTTTEQTTTQQSTTEQSTTQQSTTEQSTTQQSTTEQSTTQQSTTEQSTTQQSTTASEQTTNQPSSTTQQTTTSEQTTTTTTEQSTTTSSEQTTTTTEDTTTTTTQSTTSESTTAEQSTTQESNTEESTENQSSTTEQSSTTQESTEGNSTTENGQETTTEKENSDKECPDTDDDQYLYVCPTGFKRHPKYCNLFYQCTEDDDSHEVKVAVFTCPNNTIYDENKIQCVEEDKADKKCDGQISQKRRVKRLDANYKEPIIVNRQKYSCPSVGHFPFEKNEECSPVLLKCEATKTGKLRGLVYQCPEGYVYWSISRRCEPKNSLPDCKRSYSEWSGRYEIPTERKNVARKK